MWDEKILPYIGAIGAPGLVSLFVWMIYTGRVVTRFVYQEMVKDRNYWRTTAETLVTTNTIQASTIDKQTVVGDSVIKVMGAVQEARDTA